MKKYDNLIKRLKQMKANAGKLQAEEFVKYMNTYEEDPNKHRENWIRYSTMYSLLTDILEKESAL